MARTVRKKADSWRQPEPLCRLEDHRRDRLLDSYNVRCEIGDFTFLKSPQIGFSHRNVDGYGYVGETLYTLDRSVNFVDDKGRDRLPLRGFLARMPVVLDLTDLFAGQTVGEYIPLTRKLQLEVSNRLEQARQVVISEWVATVGKTPNQMSLEQLYRRMKPLLEDWALATEAVIAPVAEKLKADRDRDFRTTLYDMMQRETLRMPEWSGRSDDVEWRVWEMNGAGRRSWTRVRKGCQGSTFICVTVQLDRGPLAIVTNSTGNSAKEKVEKLITDKTYGDVVLLEGSKAAVASEARKLNAYLFGVDLIEMHDTRIPGKASVFEQRAMS